VKKLKGLKDKGSKQFLEYKGLFANAHIKTYPLSTLYSLIAQQKLQMFIVINCYILHFIRIFQSSWRFSNTASSRWLAHMQCYLATCIEPFKISTMPIPKLNSLSL